ncbi:MAG: hypothetical protein IKA12_02875 [Clostridia bacterium]|nr:hypothetical protein [Clostridia bacterium]
MSNQVQEQKDLTLSQIFATAKKALKLGVIYMIITAILATSILFTVKAFTDTKVYKSSVSFTKSTETTLPTMNYNKSNVVNKALVTTGKALTLSNEIAGNLTVTAVVPNNIKEDEEFLPTSFNITLTPSSELNLSSDEYQELLANITKEFLNLFALSTFPNESYSYDIEGELVNSEFLQVADAISANIDYYNEIISSVIALHPSASSFINAQTGNSLSDTTAKLKSLSDSVKSIAQTIVINHIDNNDNLEDYINWMISQKVAEITYYETLQSQAKNALETYNNTLASIAPGKTDGNIYVFDDEGYLKLYENLMDISAKLAQATKAKEIAQSYKDNLGAEKNQNTSAIAQIKTKLTNAHNTLSSLIEEYKVNAKAYNDVQFLSTDAKITREAYSIVDGTINTLIILLLDFSLVLIAYIVAYAQTYNKLKKQGFFNQENNN